MYAMKFICTETGETCIKGPYETFKDVPFYNEPHCYGNASVYEISDSEALDIIVNDITNFTRKMLTEAHLNPNDNTVFYPVFYEYIWEYHDQMRSGYNLIPAYMKDKPLPEKDLFSILGRLI